MSNFARNFNILINDDEVDFCYYLESLIKDKFPLADLTVVNEGKSALQLILTHKYDLLITDLKMPGFSGQNLLQEVSKLSSLQQPHHILVLSGILNTNGISGKTKKINYLSKPFSSDQLLNFLGEILKLLPLTTNSNSAEANTSANLSKLELQMNKEAKEELLLEELTKYLKENAD